MSNHTPEAIAAFPDNRTAYMREVDPEPLILKRERTAFDLGVASAKAQQYAVKRAELEAFVGAILVNAIIYPEKVQPHILGQNMSPLIAKVADALLSADGPLLDAADVWDDGVGSGFDYAAHQSTPSGASIDPPQNPYRRASS